MIKARAKKHYRTLAFVMALHTLGRRSRPRWVEAKVWSVFFCKTKRTRDRDNALASMKSAFDGITDAGIMANDSGMIHMPVRFEIDRGNPRVEITLEPV